MHQLSPTPASLLRRHVARPIAVLALVAAACRGEELVRPTRHELTVTATGKGAGRITSDPAGVDCAVGRATTAGACRATFDAGQVVTLIATSDSLTSFGGWTGACDGADPCRVTMSAPRAATAQLRGPTLRVVAGAFAFTAAGSLGSGTVTLMPGGATCRVVRNEIAGPCEIETTPGEAVTVTVDPVAGEAGVAISSNPRAWGQLCTLGVGTAFPNRFTCVGALTAAQAELRVGLFRSVLATSMTSSGSGGRGRITSDVGGIDCQIGPTGSTGPCLADVPPGTSVTLTFAPAVGTTFHGWSYDCGGSRVPRCTLIMDRQRRTFGVVSTAVP